MLILIFKGRDNMENSMIKNIIYLVIFIIGFVFFYSIGSKIKKIQHVRVKYLLVILFFSMFVTAICIKNYIYIKNNVREHNEYVNYLFSSFMGFIVSMLRTSKK